MDGWLPELRKQVDRLGSELTCVICRETMKRPSSLPCNHVFCYECITYGLHVNSVCPLCKSPARKRTLNKSTSLASIVDCFNSIKEVLAKAEQQAPSENPVPNSHIEKPPLALPNFEEEEAAPTAKSSSSTSSRNSSGTQERKRKREKSPTSASSPLLSSPLQFASVFDLDKENLGSASNVGALLPSSQELSELKRQLSAHERKIAEIDAILSQSTRSNGHDENDAPELLERQFSPDVISDDGRSPNSSPIITRTKAAGSSSRKSRSRSAEKEESKGEKKEEANDTENIRGEKQQRQPAKPKERTTFDDTVPVSAGGPSLCTRFVILGTGLDAAKTRKIRQLVHRLKGELVTKFSEDVTHIVTSDEVLTTRRTIKYILGVLHGVWIVNWKWVTSSLEKNMWVNEEEFEIRGDTAASGAPKKGRLTAGKCVLLKGRRFILHGKYITPSPNKADIQTIIQTAGGQVIQKGKKGAAGGKKGRAGKAAATRGKRSSKAKRRRTAKESEEEDENEDDESSVIVLCDPIINAKEAREVEEEYGKRGISLLWLLDSISHFECLPLEEYFTSPSED